MPASYSKKPSSIALWIDNVVGGYVMKLLWHSLCIEVHMYFYRQSRSQGEKGKHFQKAYYHQEQLLMVKFNKTKLPL